MASLSDCIQAVRQLVGQMYHIPKHGLDEKDNPCLAEEPDLMLKTVSRESSQRGITGLETAIILIAFVVVASVFAFTVLSTGILLRRGRKRPSSQVFKRRRVLSNLVV
jgi:flagellin-like protein